MRHSVWSQHVTWSVPFTQKAQPEDPVVNWGLSTEQNLDAEEKGNFSHQIVTLGCFPLKQAWWENAGFPNSNKGRVFASQKDSPEGSFK